MRLPTFLAQYSRRADVEEIFDPSLSRVVCGSLESTPRLCDVLFLFGGGPSSSLLLE
jgi:hypothetical protein